MPLTQIDASAALIVIDLQKGIVTIPTSHPATEIISRSAELAAAFRKRGLPVVLVNVTAPASGRNEAPMPKFAFPDNWTELIPELNQQPTDILISKKSRGAFIGTDLREQLEARGVTQIFLTGIATSAGVEATAFSASDYHYNVVIVSDAMTDRSLEAHNYCLQNVFPKMAEIGTTAEVLAMLSTTHV
jgi:nicotinamidase-related amidase